MILNCMYFWYCIMVYWVVFGYVRNVILIFFYVIVVYLKLKWWKFLGMLFVLLLWGVKGIKCSFVYCVKDIFEWIMKYDYLSEIVYLNFYSFIVEVVFWWRGVRVYFLVNWFRLISLGGFFCFLSCFKMIFVFFFVIFWFEIIKICDFDWWCIIVIC